MNQEPEILNQTVETAPNVPQNGDKFWRFGSFFVVAAAIFLRFYDLTLKPLHHDEGVNGFFLTTLFREGVYKYDPSNYHGPTLYYIALFFSKIFGLETFSVRASVAIFGVLTVVLILFLRRYLGTFGTLAAALTVALSPGMVYISRYFIHEIFFIFCSLAIVLGILFFIEGRKPGIFATAWMTLILLVCFLPSVINIVNVFDLKNTTTIWALRVGFFIVEAILVYLVMRMLLDWNEGRPIYLILSAASLALFFATKETAFITIGTMLIAIVCIWLWRKIYGGMLDGELGADDLSPVDLTWKNFVARCGSRSEMFLLLFICLITFLYVSIVFFSSFFTYAEGITGAVKAYDIWTKTGTKDHTQSGYAGYLKWLAKVESPILFLSAVGTLIAFLKARHRFAMFAGLWAFGLFLAYTIIPYKTPWLALSFLLPMCLVAGYGLNETYNSVNSSAKGIAALFAAVSFGILTYQTVDLNFYRYDDEEMPYVYAHTRRGFSGLIERIEYYAEKSGKGKDVSVEVVSPDYWAMPWYMKNYPRVVFHGRIVPANSSEMIVAKKSEQDDEIKTEYGAHYKLAGEYPLRPGVDLYLLVRRDLADSDATELAAPSPENLDAGSMESVPIIRPNDAQRPRKTPVGTP